MRLLKIGFISLMSPERKLKVLRILNGSNIGYKEISRLIRNDLLHMTDQLYLIALS